MIKWLMLFCISSPLNWAPSLGTQTSIPVSKSLWICHCNLGPSKFFSWVSPLLVVRQCSNLSSYAISRKANEPNLKIDKKPNFDPILAHLAQIWAPKYFLRVFSLLLQAIITCNLKEN